MGNWQKSNPSPRRRFYPRPKWGPRTRPAYQPRTPRQERKYRTPRAFSVRGEWRYSDNRAKEREKQIKKSVRTVFNINQAANTFWRWLMVKVFRVTVYKPERIDPNIYVVEVGE